MSEEEKIPVPRHIGIIMDGNGRWAKRRGLPRQAGHRKGAEVFKEIARACQARGVEVLTMYAFSTENWKRPKEEVDAIMDLLRRFLKDAKKYQRDNMKLRFLGDRTPLAPDLQALMEDTEKGSASNTGMTVNIALNYGGRDEIVHGVRHLAEQVAQGLLRPQDIDEESISQNLYTRGQPDPDLIIRPSGEYRTSNFLLWQSAYAELIFMDVLWPDFTPKDLDRALMEYAHRNRRFGGI